MCVSFSATAGVRLKSVFWPYPEGPPRLSEVAFQRQACREFLDLHLTDQASSSQQPHIERARLVSDSMTALQFVSACQKHLPGKQFFATSRGILGLGPSIVQASDALVVLFGNVSGNAKHGSYLPFILRPVGNLWRLVGPCFVYDVMTGQIYDEWKKSGGLAEDFCIY